MKMKMNPEHNIPAKSQEFATLQSEIHKLAPRLKAILGVARKFHDDLNSWRIVDSFYSTFTRRNLGFQSSLGENNPNYIGIFAGTCSFDLNLFVDEDGMCHSVRGDKLITSSISDFPAQKENLEHMRKFVQEFPKFERQFYKKIYNQTEVAA